MTEHKELLFTSFTDVAEEAVMGAGGAVSNCVPLMT